MADVSKYIALAKRNPSGLLEDPEFPANNTSLFGDGPAKRNNVAWKRPSEITKLRTALFVEGTEEGDVLQGSLGDCWFLGALALVATRTDLIKQLVVSTHPEHGLYQFRFYKSGDWITVTVDDRIPCEGNTPLYASCRQPNELWVPLMEKAYAKLHGSYAAIESGLVSYGLVDLTGGGSEDLQLEAVSAGIWDRIVLALEQGWLLGCAASQPAAKAETDTGNGILVNHAYSILDAKTYEGQHLLRVRNPWGRTEWKGEWSDQSSKWTAAAKKTLGHTLDNDGTFWISLVDWSKIYNRVYLCRLYSDSVGKQWHRYVMKGQWTRAGKQAGGCSNYPTFLDNPQYLIVASQATPAFISLFQNDTRLNGKPSTSVAPNLARTRQASRLTAQDQIVKLESIKFEADREAALPTEFTPDMKTILIPSTFEPNFEQPFTLIIYSKEALAITDLNNNKQVSETAMPQLKSGIDADDNINSQGQEVRLDTQRDLAKFTQVKDAESREDQLAKSNLGKSLGSCGGCNQPIYDSERHMTALDKVWHSNCLCCARCKNRLTGNFLVSDKKPYCSEGCLNGDRPGSSGPAVSCGGCGRPVQATESRMQALNKTFHEACFRCNQCRGPVGKQFYNMDGKPVCQSCGNKPQPASSSAPTKSCGGCGRVITPGTSYMQALDKFWHDSCFVCASCRKDLDGTFYPRQNKPYCANCKDKVR